MQPDRLGWLPRLLERRSGVCRVERHKPSDTPMRALLEGLAYSAIVEGNAAAFRPEIVGLCQRTTVSDRPEILVVAPTVYWSMWQSKASASGWEERFHSLCSRLARALGTSMRLIDIGHRCRSQELS
jgi:hypothetical protein